MKSRPFIKSSLGPEAFETTLCYAPFTLLTAKTNRESYPSAI